MLSIVGIIPSMFLNKAVLRLKAEFRYLSSIAVVVFVCGSLFGIGQGSTKLERESASKTDTHSADFEIRCSDPAVVRCYGFDELPPTSGNATGIDPAWDGKIRAKLDTSVKASGGGSLRFDIPSVAQANVSGDFHMDFADDQSVQFGNHSPEGDEFYVQWRQRFDDGYMKLNASSSGGGGMKQVIIGLGSQKPTVQGQRMYWASSCTDLHLVLTDDYHQVPRLYHNCGTKDNGGYQGLVPEANGDYQFQDAVGCLRSNLLKGDLSKCFRYFPNEWMTFQIHVKAGRDYSPFAESTGKMPANPNSRNYHHDSTVELWIAREGKPSQLVISLTDYDLVQHVTEDGFIGAIPKWQWWGTNGGAQGANPGTEPRYGRIWLLPYDTGRTTAGSFPPASTWFDELIVSKRRIPDPWVKTPNPPDDLVVINRGGQNHLRWRDNSSVQGSEPATGFVIERCNGDVYANCYAGTAKFEPVAKVARIIDWIDKPGSGKKNVTYRVKAFNETGDSAYTNAATDVPGPVADVTASAVSLGGVLVTWSQMSPEDSTEFLVARCSGSVQACSLKDENYRPINCAEGKLGGDARKCTDKNVIAGATYTYRVRSANSAGSYKGWGGEVYGPTSWAGGTKASEITVTKP